MAKDFAKTGVIIRERRSQSLSTLGNLVALIIGTKLPITVDFRMLKAEVSAFMSSLTSGEGKGLMFGLANGNLSAAEISECLQANGPLNPSDRIPQERAKRAVWLIGSFNEEIATEGFFDSDLEAGRGHKMVIKPRWTFTQAESWNWFVWNMGAALTTGSTVEMLTTDFGVWVT